MPFQLRRVRCCSRAIELRGRDRPIGDLPRCDLPGRDQRVSIGARAEQMRRDLHYVWPRAESNIYVEPKRLVEQGLAHSETQSVGRRPRTIYTITPEGRQVLKHWLRADSAPSRYESETLLKILYG